MLFATTGADNGVTDDNDDDTNTVSNSDSNDEGGAGGAGAPPQLAGAGEGGGEGVPHVAGGVAEGVAIVVDLCIMHQSSVTILFVVSPLQFYLCLHHYLCVHLDLVRLAYVCA
jgi:hypothetical protein